MRSNGLFLLAIAAIHGFSTQAIAGLSLGTAGNFAVLAGSSVNNSGPSMIDGGNVGALLVSSITGFPPGTIASPFAMHSGDAVAATAEADLASAYGIAAGLTRTRDLTGQGLGGMVLTPGVYFFSSSAQLTGTLTLDDQGDPNAQFVFQIASTLTTASNSSVATIHGGSIPGADVFWQVGSSATLGTDTAFEGHLLAFTSITLDAGATLLDGSALAIGGAVTLDTNLIINSTSVPEPASIALALVGGTLPGLLILAGKWRGRRHPG